MYHAAPAEFNAKNVYSNPYLREVTPVHSVTGIGLAEWRNDQYAKVKVVTQQLMDQCLQQFEQQLPILLKK